MTAPAPARPDSSPPPESARGRISPTPADPGKRKPRTVRWIALVAAVVAVAFFVVLATRPSAQSVSAESPLLGKPAPEVIGQGLDDTKVRLSQLRGRYVLLNFFATWCVPCLREHDDLVRFQEAHRSAGDATVLAVIFDDTAENSRRFFAKRGGDWPVITDERGKVSLDFGVRGPPESFLIDPDGIVLTRIIGEVDDVRLNELLRRAEQLRSAGRAPDRTP